MFINYAHRGASAYAPENTMLSFYLGLYMQANGIETDVQMTKDGKLVLFHDHKLERVTGAVGSIQEYTWHDLQQLRVLGNGREDRIVSLEDFLMHFAFRDIIFAIEIKQPYIEEEILQMLNHYAMRAKTVITSFQYENLERVRALDGTYEIGFLVDAVNPHVIEQLHAVHAQEVCPHAAQLTPEMINRLHAEGFRVRAWGVSDVEAMRHAYDCGTDGMTVNFPDQLADYIQAHPRKKRCL